VPCKISPRTGLAVWTAEKSRNFLSEPYLHDVHNKIFKFAASVSFEKKYRTMQQRSGC
jgi:hypothetical protein